MKQRPGHPFGCDCSRCAGREPLLSQRDQLALTVRLSVMFPDLSTGEPHYRTLAPEVAALLEQFEVDSSKTSAQQSVVASKSRKGIDREVLFQAMTKVAAEAWKAGLPADRRGWKKRVAHIMKVARWPIVEHWLSEWGLKEGDLIDYLRDWRPLPPADNSSR